MNITIDINETLLRNFGAEQIKYFIEKQIKLFELQLAADKIHDAMQNKSDIDWENEFEKARQETWNEYKTRFFKH